VNPTQDLLALGELRSLIRRGRYDMVHTHLSKAGIVGRLAARGLARRIVHTVHIASFGPGYHPIASAVFHLAERRCASFTDGVNFVGHDLLEFYHRSGVGSPRTSRVIRSPIDIEQFLETRLWTEAQRLDVRRRLGVDPQIPMIVAIGALEARKRHALMITGLKPLLSTGKVNLVIAGDGRERASLERLTARYELQNRVLFLGQVAEVDALLAASDLLVHTSSVEGVSQVVIQALAAAKPVVATDVTGLREVTGAPVTVIPASGEGLAADVATQLAHPPAPVEAHAFSPWTYPVIDGEIAAFHSHLDA
jgi:glycosyltransferase involved in cell wall biosynthesis